MKPPPAPMRPYLRSVQLSLVRLSAIAFGIAHLALPELQAQSGNDRFARPIVVPTPTDNYPHSFLGSSGTAITVIRTLKG